MIVAEPLAPRPVPHRAAHDLGQHQRQPGGAYTVLTYGWFVLNDTLADPLKGHGGSGSPHACRSAFIGSLPCQAFAGELNGHVGDTTTESRVRGGGYQGLAVDELWAADGYEGDDKGSASSVFKQWKVRGRKYHARHEQKMGRGILALGWSCNFVDGVTKWVPVEYITVSAW